MRLNSYLQPNFEVEKSFNMGIELGMAEKPPPLLTLPPRSRVLVLIKIQIIVVFILEP